MNSRNRWLVPACVLGLLGVLVVGRAGADERSEARALDRRIDLALYEVINKGTDIFNNGDPAGCARLFEGSLVSVRPLLVHRPGLQQEITEGLAKAQGVTRIDLRAHALRAVLDRVRDGVKSVPETAPGQTVKTPTKGAPVAKELVLSLQERTLLDLVNQERAKVKLPPLRANALLFAVARAHSGNMAEQDKMAHKLDGKEPLERLQAAGYLSYTWGENVAARYATPAEAMGGWMNSPGHRDNILNPEFTEIGLGIVANQKGSLFFTQVFGAPASTTPSVAR